MQESEFLMKPSLSLRLLRNSLVAILAIMGTLSLTTTSVIAARTAPHREVSNCDDPKSECFSLSYTDASGAVHQLLDSSGRPLDPATTGQVTGGTVLTVQGKNWRTDEPYQVWASEPFGTLSQEPNSNECYIRVDASNRPNGDGTFTSSFTVPEIPASRYPTGAYMTIETGGPGIGCLKSDQESEEVAEDVENQAFEVSFKVFPTPAAAPCTVAQNNPCLTVSPGVVYPGKSVTVTGQGWAGSSVGLYLYSGTTASCTIAVGTANTTAGNFTQTIAAPPLPTLPVSTGTSSLPAQYQVLAVSPAPATGDCVTPSAQSKSAPLYVSQPTLSATTGVHFGDSVKITGQYWAANGGATSHLTQSVDIAVYVSDNTSFDCSKATVYHTTSDVNDPQNGTFSVSYPAERVSGDTLKQVRAVAVPHGASLATGCAAAAPSAATTTCTTSQTDASQCPLMAVSTTFKILPMVNNFSWLYVLIPLALLGLLLPLFFLLGRRDETEVIETVEDVERERDIVDYSTPSQFVDATFTRRIRVTRTLINLRNGKVKDQEIHEYDVFRDAQGREVRSLRQPGIAPTPTPPAPAPTV